jgi:hypothetical protein
LNSSSLVNTSAKYNDSMQSFQNFYTIHLLNAVFSILPYITLTQGSLQHLTLAQGSLLNTSTQYTDSRRCPTLPHHTYTDSRQSPTQYIDSRHSPQHSYTIPWPRQSPQHSYTMHWHKAISSTLLHNTLTQGSLLNTPTQYIDSRQSPQHCYTIHWLKAVSSTLLHNTLTQGNLLNTSTQYIDSKQSPQYFLCSMLIKGCLRCLLEISKCVRKRLASGDNNILTPMWHYLNE